ncbi:MAG: sigma-70 family RNA polymerase sigma factor [Polyangiaceae bacterium]
MHDGRDDRTPEPATVEGEMRAHCAKKDYGRAAELGLRTYGQELLGFLLAFHHDETDAGEVFAIVSEKIWAGLPTFAGNSSFRTWAYVIARNASLNYRKQAKRRARLHVLLPSGSLLSNVVEELRQETAAFQRTAVKDRIAQLREALSDEEQAILSLRVDRQLSWDDLVRVMRGGSSEDLSPEVMRRESARLRKRFQQMKRKLADLARREGLMGRGED